MKQYTQDPNPFSAAYKAGHLDTTTGLWALASNDDADEVANGVVVSINGLTFVIAVADQVDGAHGLGAGGSLWLSAAGAIVVQDAPPAGVFSQKLGTIAGANRLVIHVEPAVGS